MFNGAWDGFRGKLQVAEVCLTRRLPEIDCSSRAHAYRDRVVSRAMSAAVDNHLEESYFAIKMHFRCEPYISQAKNKHLRKLLAMF